MVAVRLANMRQGERTDLSQICERSVSQPEAAKLLNEDVDAGRVAEANAIPDVKDIRDKVVAIEGYMRQQKAGTAAISKATTIRLRAERKLGLLLKAMPKNKGSRGRIQERLSSGGCNAQPPDGPPTYQELGINKKAASRYQPQGDAKEQGRQPQPNR